MYFTVDGEICPIATSLYVPRSEDIFPLHFWERVNSVTNYRGRRAGEAHLLVTKAFRDAVSGLTGPVDIEIIDDSGTTTMAGWTVVHCEAIETYQSTNQLYYCQLRDRRWLAEQIKVSDSYTLLEDAHNFAITGSMTWQEVLDALWTLMSSNAKGSSVACPTLASTPASNAEFLNFDGLSVWQAICQTLAACGHVAVYNQATSTYSFVKHFTTQSGLSALISSSATYLVWDGNNPTIFGNAYPETIKVTFPPRLHTVITHSSYGKPVVKSVSSGIALATTGSVQSVVDTSLALLNGDDLLNGSQLDNRLTDLTATIKGMARAANDQSVLAYNTKIASFVPGSQVTQVTIAEHARKGVYTKVEHWEPFELDLPKPQERAYSTVEVVNITNYTPDANGLYDAEVLRYDPNANSWTSLYTCKVLDLNA